MQFTATLADRDPLRGHYYLEDVQAENGMHRAHCWVNSQYCGMPYLSFPCKVRIQGRYRRYRTGPDGWTIGRVDSVEVLR